MYCLKFSKRINTTKGIDIFYDIPVSFTHEISRNYKVPRICKKLKQHHKSNIFFEFLTLSQQLLFRNKFILNYTLNYISMCNVHPIVISIGVLKYF